MTNPSGKTSAQVPTLGLICVGGCGTNNALEVLRELDPDKHGHLYILVCNTDHPQLEHHFAAQSGDAEDQKEKNLQKWLKRQTGESAQLSILHLGESGMGAGGLPEVGEEVTRASIGTICEFLGKVKVVVIVGGAGKGSGSGGIPVIAQLAKDGGKSPLVILTMPRAAEGGKRLKKAQQVRDKLNAICPTIVIYNENIPKESLTLTYKEVWSEINLSCLLPMLLALQEIILEVGDLNFDLNDYVAGLSEGNFAQFGRCDITAEKGESLKSIAEQLLSNIYQDHTIVNKARQIFGWLHGKSWTVQEHDALVACLREQMSKDIPEDEIEINFGIYQTVQDDKKWAAIVAVAKDPPADAVSPGAKHKVAVTGEIRIRAEGEEVQEKIPLTTRMAAGLGFGKKAS